MPKRTKLEIYLINFIKSLDRVMDSWDNLTLRRTIVNVFTIMIFIQIIIFTAILLFGGEVSTNCLGVMGLEFGAWGTILAYYFNARAKAEAQAIEDKKEENEENTEGGE